MEPDTFETALHMWPDWAASIEQSRLDLGYDVSAPIKFRIDWIEANYSKIKARAQSEVDRLQLQLNFTQYREDCFYCDYMNDGGLPDLDRITRRIGFVNSGSGEFEFGIRSRPPPTIEYALIWDEDRNLDRDGIRLEFTVQAKIFKKELLRQTIDDSYRSVQLCADLHHHLDRYQPSPSSEIR